MRQLDTGPDVRSHAYEPDDFLKARETLSGIGVASRKERTLYQSCHILHQRVSAIS